MLSHKEPSGSIEGKALAIADAGGIAFLGGKNLAGLIGVVAPCAAAGLEFGAGVHAGRSRNAVLGLAGVGGGAQIDKQFALGVDHERMHWVIAGQRQP